MTKNQCGYSTNSIGISNYKSTVKGGMILSRHIANSIYIHASYIIIANLKITAFTNTDLSSWETSLSKQLINDKNLDQGSPNTVFQKPYKKICDILRDNTVLVLLYQCFPLQAFYMMYKNICCSHMFTLLMYDLFTTI